MNTDLTFCLKIVRNALILGGLYFFSVYAVGDLTYELCKPVIVFIGTYVFAELAKYYGLNTKTNKKGNTLIF